MRSQSSMLLHINLFCSASHISLLYRDSQVITMLRPLCCAGQISYAGNLICLVPCC